MQLFQASIYITIFNAIRCCCIFQVLPQDLLLGIFNISGESDVATMRSLSLVCKGFRSITVLNADWTAPLLVKLHGATNAVVKALLDDVPAPYIDLSLARHLFQEWRMDIRVDEIAQKVAGPQYTCSNLEVYKLLAMHQLRPNHACSYLLRMAARAGYHEICMYLMDAGFHGHGVARAMDMNQAALLEAIQAGNTKICKALMDERVAGEYRCYANFDDSFALYEAVRMGNEDICKALLDSATAGYEHATVWSEDSRALIVAAAINHAGICKLLLDHGARADADYSLALQHAAQNGNIHICHMLMDTNLEHPALPNHRKGILVGAAESGVEGICELLMDPDMSHDFCNRADIDDSAPLHAAVQRGNYSAVCSLLEAGKNTGGRVTPAKADARDHGLLLDAARMGYDSICRKLVTNMNNNAVPARCRFNPLVAAASFGHDAVCSVLMDCGGQRLTDMDGAALLSGIVHPRVVRVLLEHGSPANVGDGKAYMMAVDKRQWDVCRMLLSPSVAGENHVKATQEMLVHAVQRGLGELCAMLLDVNVTGEQHQVYADYKNSSNLNIAVGFGHFDVCRVLLHPPTRTRCADAKKTGLLQIAASRGYTAICRLLLENGADANDGDALVAAAGSGAPALNTCRLLLEYGAHADVDNCQALENALCDGNAELCEMLMSQEHAGDHRAQESLLRFPGRHINASLRNLLATLN